MGDVATGYDGFPTSTLQIALLDSTYTFDATVTSFFGSTDITGAELATANGYTQVSSSAATGESLASVTSSQPSAGVWMLDAADASWTASGGSIGPATDAVVLVFDITTPAHPAVFTIDFGSSESAGDGTDFIVSWNANGICRIS